MSFVSMVANENFVVMVSDGLETMEHGQFVSNDTQKFRLFDKTLISFVGSYNDFDGLYSMAGSEYKRVSSLENALKNIGNQAGRIPFENYGSKVKCIAAGFKNGVGFQLQADNENNTVNVNKLTSDLSYAFIAPSGVSQQEVEQIFINLLTSTPLNNADDIIEVQSQLNDYVADRDDSVNHRIFSKVIIK